MVSFSFDFHGAAFQTERLAVNESIRHFPPGFLDDPRESRPRNLHLFRRLLLIQPLQVGQTQRFDLIESQRYLFESARRNTRRLEEAGVRPESYMTQTTRSWH
jgi:hypothetical protein